MEDVLTEAPPPSRFFQEDLNVFTRPSPSLPTAFLLLSEPYANKTIHPSILIIAISQPSLQIFHHVSSKTLIGTLVLPEIPFSGNSIKPSLKDKSCNIYSLDDSKESVAIVFMQYSVPTVRSYAVSKLLLGGQIVPDKVVIFDTVQPQNFRGKLHRDEACVYKLQTSAERKRIDGSSPLFKNVDYFPSGSVTDGLGAALLAECQIRSIKGTLCVSWPEFGNSALLLLRSLLLNDALPGLDMSSDGAGKQSSISGFVKNPLFDAEIYT